MRKITVISTQRSAPQTYNSAATTWGQLKDAISSDLGNLSNMKAVIKESRTTLEMDESVLPEGDFTLFLTPTKIKAGGVDVVAVLNDLKSGFDNAFLETISKIEEGKFDVEDDHENVPVGSTAKVNNGISDEDLAFLNQLKAKFSQD